MQRSFVSILLWYGDHPFYLPCFLRSIADNPELHVLWIGDNPPGDLPANVSPIRLSFQDLILRVNQKLGIRFNPENAYKLCDLKPALGLLFREYIGEAEYWGPIDCDIVAGEFRRFIPEIQACDVFSCRKNWFSASFAFLKNDEKCRKLFMKSPDWKQALEAPSCQLFDECGKSADNGKAPFPELRSGKSLADIPVNYISFTHVLLDPKSDLNLSFADRTKESLIAGQVLGIKQGALRLVKAHRSVFPVGFGFTHYHMVAEKTKRFFRLPSGVNWRDIPSEYFLSETGYYPKCPSDRRIHIDRWLHRISC